MEFATSLTFWDFVVILIIVQLPVWIPVLRDLCTMPTDCRKQRAPEVYTPPVLKKVPRKTTKVAAPKKKVAVKKPATKKPSVKKVVAKKPAATRKKPTKKPVKKK